MPLSRVASGDQEGRVVVWDIATGTPVISLEDPVQAAGGARSRGGAVKGLAWVMANPARLAIVLAGGMVLVWDVQGEASPLFSQQNVLGRPSYFRASSFSEEVPLGKGSDLGQCQSRTPGHCPGERTWSQLRAVQSCV